MKQYLGHRPAKGIVFAGPSRLAAQPEDNNSAISRSAVQEWRFAHVPRREGLRRLRCLCRYRHYKLLKVVALLPELV
jgi:hypothetical protein